MAKPEDKPPAPGQESFVVTHPHDPSSPKTVTQEQWVNDKMGQNGWVKRKGDEPYPEQHS